MTTAFSQYANKLIFSTASTTANPLFYSTYNGSDEGDHDDGQDHHSNLDEGVESDNHALDKEDGEQRNRLESEMEGGTTAANYPASRLWEIPNLASSFTSMLPNNLNRVSRGWKTHLSTAEVYRERYELDDHDDDPEREEEMSSSAGSLSPPEFLSRPLLPSTATLPHSTQPDLTIPLLQPSTLYVYPSSSRGVGGRIELRKYRNSSWIVIYGTSLIGLICVGVNEWINNETTVNYPIIPVLPLLILLSALSVIAGVSSLAYLILVRNSIRHLIMIALIGGPAILVLIGLGGVSGSFNNDGIEQDSRWKNGMRLFSLGCFIVAYILGNIGLRRRKQANRTIKVLEVSLVLYQFQLWGLIGCKQ
jgi:multisubunit Na+/H+ antiporter MnhC subunit